MTGMIGLFVTFMKPRVWRIVCHGILVEAIMET